MAFIDMMMENGSGKKIHVRVPSDQGGTDRNVYIGGRLSGYYLGNGNNCVYKSGSYVAKTLKDLVENVLWEIWGCFCASFFYCKFVIFCIIKTILHITFEKWLRK